MEILITTIITSLTTLSGIYLRHYLEKKKECKLKKEAEEIINLREINKVSLVIKRFSKYNYTSNSSLDLSKFDDKVIFEDENFHICFEPNEALQDEKELKTLHDYSKLITKKIN